MGSVLPDIGRATATMCLRIAYATPTAATNEIACRYVGQSDTRQRGRNTSRYRLRKRRSSLKGPGGLAI
jgi:hypothetical protein